MSFHNLTKAENELYYENGIRNGLTLKERQQLFLKQTKVQKILTCKKKQREYQELFKF